MALFRYVVCFTVFPWCYSFFLLKAALIEIWPKQVSVGRRALALSVRPFPRYFLSPNESASVTRGLKTNSGLPRRAEPNIKSYAPLWCKSNIIGSTVVCINVMALWEAFSTIRYVPNNTALRLLPHRLKCHIIIFTELGSIGFLTVCDHTERPMQCWHFGLESPWICNILNFSHYGLLTFQWYIFLPFIILCIILWN